MVDSKGQPRSPEQIINLPTLEDTVKKILSESNPQQYISLSMLREDINLLESKLIPKWFTFTSGEDAFEKLGEIVESQSKHYLGELNPKMLGETRTLVQVLCSILGDCEQTFILKLAQDLDAFDSFVFEKLLHPIDNHSKIVEILNYIANHNNNPGNEAIEIFNSYLIIACKVNGFDSLILPHIQLLNKKFEWKSPEYLCDGEKNYEIDLTCILDDKQRKILYRHLENLSILNIKSDLQKIESNIEIDNEECSIERLEKYFLPWIQFLPSQIIGGILALLSGSDQDLQRLAQRFLQRHSLEDICNDLLGVNPKYTAFQFQINSGKMQEVINIKGEVFFAPILSSKIPKTIFLGEITSSINLREINLDQLDSSQLEKILYNSFIVLVKSLNTREDKSSQSFLIEDTWKRLADSSRLEVETAKNFILKHSVPLFKNLGVRSPEISEYIHKLNSLDFN